MLGNWTVDSFQTAPGTLAAPIEGTQLSAVFGIASVGGSGGCNQYTGTYGTNGNIVRIGRLATTRLACADEIMTQETAFLTAMEGAALIQLRGDAMNLTDLSGTIVVALVRPSPEPGASPGPTTPPPRRPSRRDRDRIADRRANRVPDRESDTRPDGEPDTRADPASTADSGADGRAAPVGTGDRHV